MAYAYPKSRHGFPTLFVVVFAMFERHARKYDKDQPVNNWGMYQ
jgi:hypothetical protein